MRTIKEPQVETDLHKLDISLFRKKSSAKSFRGYLVGCMKKARDDENMELVHLFNHLLQKYNELEVQRFNPKRWRGKSGVSFIEHPDYVIAVRYRKNDIDEKPIETRTEMTKDEINKVLQAIFQLNEGNPLKTSEIAEETYKRAWQRIFSDRQTHIKLTEILNYLEYKEKIVYSRSGVITLK